MMLHGTCTVFLGFCLSAPVIIDAARILAIFPFFSKSHFNFNEALMKSLHAAGHHITAIHSFPDGDEIENYTVIDASREDKPNKISRFSISHVKPHVNSLSMYNGMMNNAQKDCENVLTLKDIQHILHADQPPFDLMFVDVATFLHECYFPLAEKMNVPLIGTASTRSWKHTEWMLGNPYPPAIVPYEMGSYRSDRMSFVQRLTNTYDCIFDYFYQRLYASPRLEILHQQHFSNRVSRSKIKPSLLFVNGHNLLLPRPLLPNIIYVGGIHLNPTNSLPQDLQKFIDEAEHGVIVFSVGSFLRSDKKSSHLLLPFVEAFSQIPQRVIWKSDEKLENVSENILQLEWIPQRDLLVQKKVLAFITHSGIGGIFEAIDAAKPLILMHVFFDQLSNAALLERLGAGICIDIWSMTTPKLLTALNSIVNDTRYRDRMQELSQIFKDRPTSLQNTVVYWTEYVLKYKGASHLESTAAGMPIYQYLLLDVILFFAIIMAGIILGLYYIAKRLYIWAYISRKLKKACHKKNN